MEKYTYVSNELRQAFPNDLKMRKDDKIILKINILVWIKRIDHKVIDFFGPIALDGNSSKKLLDQINSLLKEGRVFITKQSFENIPDNIVESNYRTNDNI